jgi:hypothetical protein
MWFELPLALICLAVEIVKERLRRVTRALNLAQIPYAVIGGNAVQHWVAQVDESVVRNTRVSPKESKFIYLI